MTEDHTEVALLKCRMVAQQVAINETSYTSFSNIYTVILEHIQMHINQFHIIRNNSICYIQLYQSQDLPRFACSDKLLYFHA